MAHVSESKKKTVEEFAKLIDEYPVIGVVNMLNLPARTVQKMREKLREKGTVLRMTKKRLLKIAFSKVKKENVGDLQSHFKGLPALIFTKDNPFTLYAELEKTKSNAPAKGGSEAPKDITVKAGPTSFAPGPIIGQLAQFGIKTGVENGKLAIKADAIVAKRGDIISAELAGILTRLGIEPMEIGLDLTAAYENGSIFTSDLLYIDEVEYMNKFMTAYNESLNLAVSSGYPTTESLQIMISKVVTQSRSLSIESGFITDDTAKDIVMKAHVQMTSLSNNLSEDAKPKGIAPIQTTPTPVETEKKDEPKPDQQPKEEKKPEEAAAGLGALFG
ncbi:50S ribosomal protein L10 [archaeon]|jgi:large subunit ribosomal protein L10|nr:50S ribosomal protein L10 [archaeon]MBT4272758.1 50S ribosomal protein L10 [archaeon]MBT4461557.1 50S ribosomal protein L10 [archaeon]MBT4857675.1 50S ribosomal protein L10 [archaeon]MBT5423251.1 50S ribosomal protein L10 [archaeon]